MMVHDIIKMRLSSEGYLPNYPYHLISDEEMCDAFLSDSELCYFKVNYPCLNDNLQSAYNALVSAIQYHINKLKSSKDDSAAMPDWVYSYMLGEVVSINSPTADIHDMLVPMGIDNLYDVFTEEASAKCFEISQNWVRKLPPESTDHRPPTIFGEPHVIKYLRLQDVSVLT